MIYAESAAATAETEVEVMAATQRIDVYAVPDPNRAAERPKMGLLGELSTEPSLFEPFRNTPSLARVRACLRKQLTWHHELERRARAASGQAADEDADADADAAPIVPFPWLVVISPGRPETVLEVYGCKEILPGVYEAIAGLRLRVVVLVELRLGSGRRRWLRHARHGLAARRRAGGPLVAAGGRLGAGASRRRFGEHFALEDMDLRQQARRTT